MSDAHEDVLAWLEGRISGSVPSGDILDIVPDLTVDQAYELQFELMARRVERGDRVIGYKAAYTSEPMQKAFGVPGPAIGTLLASYTHRSASVVQARPDVRINIEPEVAVLLRRTLTGPKINETDVLAAVEGYLPAIEVAPSPLAGAKRSRQMGTAMHKVTDGIVVGDQITAPGGIDLRQEGVVVRVNGVPRGSGTAVEVLGNPLTVVAHIANELSRFGKSLEAGMLILTGSVIAALPVVDGDDLLVEFSRLGSVRALFRKQD